MKCETSICALETRRSQFQGAVFAHIPRGFARPGTCLPPQLADLFRPEQGGLSSSHHLAAGSFWPERFRRLGAPCVERLFAFLAVGPVRGDPAYLDMVQFGPHNRTLLVSRVFNRKRRRLLCAFRYFRRL